MASMAMEKKPLIDEAAANRASSGLATSVLIPDIVITFPRSVPEEGEERGWMSSGPRAFDADELSELFEDIGMTVSETGGKDCVAYTKCKELTEQFKEDKKTVTLDEVQDAIVADLAEYLWGQGCCSSAFMSCDRDELFVLISLGESTETAQAEAHEVAIKVASRQGLKLQTCYTPARIEEKFHMKQDVNPGEEMYKMLIRNHHDGNPFDGYKKYSTSIAGTHGSILRAVDKYSLLKDSIIDNFMDLEDALGESIINDFYIPHNMSKLEEFRCGKAAGEEEWDAGHPAWSTFSFRTIMTGLQNEGDAQPITEIRNYFGERIGFYFLWLAFTARFFALMCLPAVCFFFAFNVCESEILADAHIFAALLFSISLAMYLKMWTRLQSHYFELWGVGNMQKGKEHVLPSYRGTQTPDDTNGHVKSKMYPSWKALVVLFTSRTIAVFFMCFVMVTVALVYMLEEQIPVHFPNMTRTTAISITSAIFSVQILVYQQVWNYLSGTLVGLANPRTEADALNLSVEFLFPFSMVSTYANIIYHAFYKSWGKQCMSQNCMLVMRPAMLKVVVPALFMQIISLLQPYMVYRYQLYAEEKRLLSRSAGTEARVDRTFIEVQAKREPFNVQAFYKEMNLAMVFFGYFALFAFVTPSITLPIAVMFLLKVRIDAFKLCSIYQRVAPASSGVDGIGGWNSMLHLVCNFGRWTSFAIPIFNLDAYQSTDSHVVRFFTAVKMATTDVGEACVIDEEAHGLTFFQKLLLTCLLKMLTDLLCSAIDHVIPDVAWRTKVLTRKREAVRLRDMAQHAMASAARRTAAVGHMFSMTSKVSVVESTERKWYEQVADRSLKSLNSSHPDWNLFEKKDFAPWRRSSTYLGGAQPVGVVPTAATAVDPEALVS